MKTKKICGAVAPNVLMEDELGDFDGEQACELPEGHECDHSHTNPKTGAILRWPLTEQERTEIDDDERPQKRGIVHRGH
jgi:hypothetical protein